MVVEWEEEEELASADTTEEEATTETESRLLEAEAEDGESTGTRGRKDSTAYRRSAVSKALFAARYRSVGRTAHSAMTMTVGVA